MIYPMYFMFLLIPLVAVVMFRARVKAVRTKALSFKYFRAMSGDSTVPEYAAIPARHFLNLFELPLLFYVVCLAAMILHIDGPVMVGLAWAFVSCRYVQALIHLTYNHVFHRMLIYGAGLLVLVIMWTLLAAWTT